MDDRRVNKQNNREPDKPKHNCRHLALLPVGKERGVLCNSHMLVCTGSERLLLPTPTNTRHKGLNP
jgi:hypothetical protein